MVNFSLSKKQIRMVLLTMAYAQRADFDENCVAETHSTCSHFYMSHRMGKPTICIGENKGADQLRGNREADQCLCFRYSDSTIPLLLKSEISSF